MDRETPTDYVDTHNEYRRVLTGCGSVTHGNSGGLLGGPTMSSELSGKQKTVSVYSKDNRHLLHKTETLVYETTLERRESRHKFRPQS